MSGIVEILVNSGKKIVAINFAHAFGLVNKFPPVLLLKAYLKDSKKASQGKSGTSQVRVIFFYHHESKLIFFNYIAYFLSNSIA